MFTIICCVIFQSIILCLVFIGCGKGRKGLTKKGKKGAVKKGQKKLPPPPNGLQFQRQSNSQPLSQPKQSQSHRQQQSQSARPLQKTQSEGKKKEVEKIEVKKVEPPSTKQQSQSQKQQKPKEQNVETPPVQAAEAPADLPQPVMAESPVAPAQEEDEDLCFDSTPPELKKLVQELECY